MVAFLLSAVVASIFTPVSESLAQEVTISNDKTGFYVTVTNSDDVNLSVDGTPVGQVAISNVSTVNVKTNAPLGYKLYLSTADDELRATDTSITQTFKPVTSTDLSSSINKWGFSLSGEDNSWLAVPEVTSGNESSGYLLSSSSVPNLPNGTNTDIYYGINANTTMPTGTYTTTVTYTAIAEGTEDIPLMQDFTLTECANMDMDTTTTLMDKRNGKSYTIVKARDGNCWMADNLSLYSQDEDHPITISDADSNLPANTTITLPTSTTWNNNNYTDMLIHVADGTGSYADKTGEYYGEVYYNWAAATGGSITGSGTVNQSICPKGWRLPVNGGTTTDKSWAKLMSAYSATTGAQLLDSSNPAYLLGFRKYYGGWHWENTTEGHQGAYGTFWSATGNSSTNTAYTLHYSSATIEPQYNYSKSYGYNIRCVMDNPVTIQNVTYMQDVTATICANTPTDATWRLLDKRGYGNGGNDKTTKYGVIKARDGNCWMTDNLNLYNKTISYADSDFTSGTFAIPASSNWTDAAYQNPTAVRMHVGTNTGYVGEAYYNWVAATAGSTASSGTVNQSICPKGWRLPINGDATQDKSWTKLFDAYNATTGDQLMDSNNPAHSLGFYKYYGYWSWLDVGEKNQGISSLFWSSSARNAEQGELLSYTNTYIHSIDGTYGNKSYGDSIRCALK